MFSKEKKEQFITTSIAFIITFIFLMILFNIPLEYKIFLFDGILPK